MWGRSSQVGRAGGGRQDGGWVGGALLLPSQAQPGGAGGRAGGRKSVAGRQAVVGRRGMGCHSRAMCGQVGCGLSV